MDCARAQAWWTTARRQRQWAQMEAVQAEAAPAELGSAAMVTRARQRGLVALLGKRTGGPGGSRLGSLDRQQQHCRGGEQATGGAQGRGGISMSK